MNLLKILVLQCIFCTSLFAQIKDEKYYYRDTVFEFAQCKIDIRKCVADDQSFKCGVVITNLTDQFIIIDPVQVIWSLAGSATVSHMALKRKVVIAPRYNKSFTAKFVGADFQQESQTINFTRIEMTDKVEAVYEIPELDVTKDLSRKVGPVTWTVKKVFFAVDKDEKKKNFRIDGIIEYTGGKFLGIFHNNIALKTSDGNTYINESKTRGYFAFVKNKYHYDNSKKFEKQTLVFPVESEKITAELKPTLSFTNVFKEYSLVTIEGFTIKLQRGTINDYMKNAGVLKDDIEEME
ncbi:MAG TPA: hypothetical protein VF868_11950 [Bacteroidia bacterium]|jgi:hypothetical protein